MEGKERNRYAISFKNVDEVTGVHVPKFLSKLGYYFLLHEGRLGTTVNWYIQYPKDREQSGFDLPPKYIFSLWNEKIMKK